MLSTLTPLHEQYRDTISMKRLCLLAVFALGWINGAVAAERTPNIVLIMADDLGVGEVGCYGGTAIPTPNIDRLAAGGLKFTNAYSVSAVCAPTRCGLMTGLHMGHATRRANGSRVGHVPLTPEEVTIAERLKEAGYATGGFGKWGLGDVGTTGVPEKQGFDVFYGYYSQTHAHNYFPAFLVRNSKPVPMPGGNGVPGKEGTGEAYSPDLITEETLAFIEANKDRPFFCYAAGTLPHGLFQIKDTSAFADRPWPEKAKAHAAMIARLDSDVGRLIEKLDSMGLSENTLVIFTSDNGADGPGRTVWDGPGGLRGWKRHLYEGGIRTPFIVWPNAAPTGATSDLLCGHVDLMATLCDVANIESPKTDGVSLLPAIGGGVQETRHDSLYWEIYEGPHPFQQAVRMDHWKGYRTALKGPLELYDLQSDPKEKRNVAAEHAGVVAKIERIMNEEHVRNPNWQPTEQPGAKKAGKKKGRRKQAA
jgi:arylsulfatase A-like enzyme